MIPTAPETSRPALLSPLLSVCLSVLLLPLFQVPEAGTQVRPSGAGKTVVQAPGPTVTVSWRRGDREYPARSGDWVPADADLHFSLQDGEGIRVWRFEAYVVEKGERRPVEVPDLQEWESETRKWIHADLDPAQAARGVWVWGGFFGPGDELVLQWRDPDSGQVAPHPVILRVVENLGARLAFATPVSLVFPVTGEATVVPSAGFSVRYYRTTNTPFWRTLDRIGFPAVGLAYANIAGERSVLYSVGLSAIDDQLHVYYGGFRNGLTANNFWMVGFALKTSDLAAAARRVLK